MGHGVSGGWGWGSSWDGVGKLNFSNLQICPLYKFRKQSATDGTKPDLNIGVSPGFGGLDFSGQIYNPDLFIPKKIFLKVQNIIVIFE